MLIFDQLKKDDPHLRFLAIVVLAGILILLTGLWWVQLVSTKYFQKSLENQSTRSVRIPAIRGKILDRNGIPLADNRPFFSVDLFLEDLSGKYQSAFNSAASRLKTNINLQIAAKEKLLGRKLKPQERKQLAVSEQGLALLHQQTRYDATTALLASLGEKLSQPISLTQTNFEKWYEKSRVLPLPVLINLNQTQIARFEEQSGTVPGVDLDVTSLRYYPNGAMAAHVLGFLERDNQSDDVQSRHFSYPLTDYKGVTGVEGLFDDALHGTAGAKSVVVNNQGFRHSETIETPPSPGENVVLTIDFNIQKAAEAAMRTHLGVNAHSAVVVMDPRNGDILTMASQPAYDPNFFVQPMDPAAREAQWELLQDTNRRPQLNRAMHENYHPGSIFKIVVGLAALEQGLDPNAKFHSLGNYPMKGLREPIGDTAGPGDFDFDRALAKSSNPYFITQGLKEGVLPRILELGHRLHFGEKTGLFPRAEARGNFPTLAAVSKRDWYPVETAYLSIGQGRIDVTPLQIAVMISAVANGGDVYFPRLVSAIVPDGETEPSETFPSARLRDKLGVSERSLRIVREAMLADVQRPAPEGTGHAAAVPDFPIAGKTGTAEVENRNGKKDRSLKDTWFVSFAPYDSPRYAVVVMVEGGASGGLSCAPVAHDIYLAIQKHEQNLKPGSKAGTLATVQ